MRHYQSPIAINNGYWNFGAAQQLLALKNVCLQKHLIMTIVPYCLYFFTHYGSIVVCVKSYLHVPILVFCIKLFAANTFVSFCCLKVSWKDADKLLNENECNMSG